MFNVEVYEAGRWVRVGLFYRYALALTIARSYRWRCPARVRQG